MAGCAADRTAGSLCRVIAQVGQAPRQIADQPQQHVEGSRLNVAPRFPAGDRVRTQTKQTSKLYLRESMVFADRSDLITREELVFLAVQRNSVLFETPGLRVREDLLTTLGAFEMRNIRHGDILPIDGSMKRPTRLL